MNRAVEQDLRYTSLLAAAASSAKVGSFTHSFYRYPARFGEAFVREAILSFSREGETIFDPFCGGGTTPVEAVTHGRRAIGSDLSELAIFVARVKTQPLSDEQLDRLSEWVDSVVSSPLALLGRRAIAGDHRLLGVPPHLRRVISAMKEHVGELPRGESQRFASCLLLRTAQWALDGKQVVPTPTRFLRSFCEAFDEMRRGMQDYRSRLSDLGLSKRALREICSLAVEDISKVSSRTFGTNLNPISLVVTSPPYLGVHVLYNRWQLEGRRELKAPYFISECSDLGHASQYTIVPRSAKTSDAYFNTISRGFRAANALLKSDAHVVQLVSFADASTSLPRYMQALSDAGLDLCETYMHSAGELAWRSVPGRRWYARVGAVMDSSAAQEVLLVHRKRR